MIKTVVIGGNGFIGRALQSSKTLQVIPVSRTSKVQVCIDGDLSGLRQLIDKDTVVINLVGILQPSGNNTFENTQVEGVRNIVQLLSTIEYKSFIHLSAIGANKKSPLSYFRTKGIAEELIMNKIGNKATIIRPSIVFGKEDSFFNRFDRMSRYMPIMPLPGSGSTKFQPIYVGDLVHIIEHIASTNKVNKIYEAVGPTIITYKEIITLILSIRQRYRLLLPIPYQLMSIIAYFLEYIPSTWDLSLSRDQVKQLQQDNIGGDPNVDQLELNIKDFKPPSYVQTYLQ